MSSAVLPVILLLISIKSFAQEPPSWVTRGPLTKGSFTYVVCSQDGIDPEEARQIAESKCLVSAAKLNGVNVRITQKTVQSLTGSDASEVAEIQPLEAKIKCEWTDRFLEKIKDGYRVWLRCKVANLPTFEKRQQSEIKLGVDESSGKHNEGTLTLTAVPMADRILVIGIGGERVLEPTTNVVNIVFSNLDQRVEIKKAGYKTGVVEVPSDFAHGIRIQRDVVLERN